VTISAPLASRAARIDSGEENLPVPRIRRDRKVRPAMTKGALSESIEERIGQDGGLANESDIT
jgi:hypothetical protein